MVWNLPGTSALVTLRPENLHRLGLDVWLDQWELVGGRLVAARLQEGLASADALVAVVSPHWTASGWCGEEFAASVTATVAGRQEVIPVLLGDCRTMRWQRSWTSQNPRPNRHHSTTSHPARATPEAQTRRRPS
jgi:uncharacterized membrane protein